MKLLEFHLSFCTPFRTGSDSKSASNTQGNKKNRARGKQCTHRYKQHEWSWQDLAKAYVIARHWCTFKRTRSKHEAMIRMSTIVKVYHKRSGDLGITIFVTQNSLGSPFLRGGGGADVERIHQETCSPVQETGAIRRVGGIQLTMV